MIQKPRYFQLEELVPRSLFLAHKHELDKLWLIFDARVLWTLQSLRMRYGKLVMNTWLWGGKSQERGFRVWTTSTGAPLSQHKCGRAADVVPIETTAEEIRQDILTHSERDEFRYIRCIEEGTAWLHFDTRNWIGPVWVVKE